MNIEVRVPTLPESVADATVVNWHKRAGETVRRDENLVDLETDKVVLEVPAPRDGVLVEVKRADGDTVTADDLLAVIDTEGAAQVSTPATPQTKTPETSQAKTPPAPGADQAAAAVASPAAQRLIREHGVDASAIEASGKGGRITKEDVLRHLEKAPAAAPGPPPAAAEPAPPAGAEAPVPPVPPGGQTDQGVRREPMSRLRARIAERMVEAQQTAAILTTFNEIDMSGVKDARRRYGEAFEKTHGVRLGFMSFFVKACVAALQRYPIVNASIDGSDILYYDRFDVGMAVASPRGLVVPVIRDADQLGFSEIEVRINDLARKARDGALSMDDLSGGTFTITNGGVFGSLLSTPILNPPQSGILGLHRIQDRPVAVDGEIAIRPMMYVALSYDHRIIDGEQAVRFLVAVKESVEDPSRILLEI
jgi:2-oxoglutarate dehydrogenase E2 component (dihydrolipoamide succinyltransferase)